MDPTTEPVFDADQHYYEVRDTFTRHVPKEWRERTVFEVLEEGRIRHVVGGKINRTVANPIFDPVVSAGCMMGYFRGNPEGKQLSEYLSDYHPSLPAYRDRDARIENLDAQGVEAAWLMPTIGMAYEEAVQYDPPAAAAMFRAFNRWLIDDWGFDYKGRLYASPYLAMGSVDEAVQEVEWMLDNGARIIAVRPSGVYTEGGWRSPGDPYFDPIWARINEANVVVIPHTGEVGSHGLDRYASHGADVLRGGQAPLEIVVGHDRPIANYLGALVCDKLFERFSNLRVASVENGSDFLPLLLKGLKRVGSQRPGYFRDNPLETFKEHIWVHPFWEDRLTDAVALLGPDRTLFGSDWPHAESLVEPRSYWEDVAPCDEDTQRKVMYRNTAELTSHKPLHLEIRDHSVVRSAA